MIAPAISSANAVAQAMTGRDYISYSAISTYCQCPLIIRDFKTSRNRWSEGQAENQGEQLLLYSELARELAPGKSLRLEFAVFSKTKEPTIERHPVLHDPQRITRTKLVIERVWQAIESGHYYPAPSAMNCPGCPFQKPCRSWAG